MRGALLGVEQLFTDIKLNNSLTVTLNNQYSNGQVINLCRHSVVYGTKFYNYAFNEQDEPGDQTLQ